MTRQIRADLHEALTFVRRLPQVLRSDIEHGRIGRRQHDRERPLKALRDVGGRISHRIIGIRIDRALLAGSAIQSGDQAAVAAGIEDVGIVRVARDVAAFAAAHGIEHLIGATAGPTRAALRLPAGHARGAVVLLRTADVIRHVSGRDDVVELRRRHRLRGPRLAAIHRDVGAAVVGLDHPLRIVRRNPHVVIVAVRRPHRRPRLAAVGRLVEADIQHVDRVFHFRVGIDARVVKRALPQVAAVRHSLPRPAGIV